MRGRGSEKQLVVLSTEIAVSVYAPSSVVVLSWAPVGWPKDEMGVHYPSIDTRAVSLASDSIS